MYNAHAITKEFEKALCEYTGAPYAVAVNSCTMAIFLAVKREISRVIEMQNMEAYVQHQINCPRDKFNPIRSTPIYLEIPKKTYVSVPQSIIHAGGQVFFRDEDWHGAYEIKHGFNIWDCARRFTTDMYIPGQVQCVSFHASKILGDSQGGAILHDNPQADAWFRRARFDGRTEGVAPKDDHFDMFGWHCYMSPDVATRLLWKLSSLPKHNEDLPNDDYPDLSKFEIFKS